MFDFRIIDTEDGNQIIDRNLKTPYNALSLLRMVEYMEVEEQLAYMDRLERKEKEERKRKFVRNPFYKMACMFGILQIGR